MDDKIFYRAPGARTGDSRVASDTEQGFSLHEQGDADSCSRWDGRPYFLAGTMTSVCLYFPRRKTLSVRMAS